MMATVTDYRQKYRAALLVQAGLGEAEAAESVGKLAGLTDAEFEAHAAFLTKHTPAKDPPRQTDLSSQMGEHPPKVKGAEDDSAAKDDGEKARASVVAWMGDLFGLDEQEMDEAREGGW